MLGWRGVGRAVRYLARGEDLRGEGLEGRLRREVGRGEGDRGAVRDLVGTTLRDGLVTKYSETYYLVK